MPKSHELAHYYLDDTDEDLVYLAICQIQTCPTYSIPRDVFPSCQYQRLKTAVQLMDYYKRSHIHRAHFPS